MRPEPLHRDLTALMIALWAVGGVLGVLANAIARILPIALEPLRGDGLTLAQAAIAAAWILWMAYTEGYRGFHRAFAPRVVVRAFALARAPRPALVVVAPLVAMGLLHATRKRLIISWAIVLGVTAIVLAVRGIAQPWRGIIDGGVVVGLALGALSILVHLAAALRGAPPAIPADMPDMPDMPAPLSRR